MLPLRLAGMPVRPDWRMKRGMLSRSYTTR
ncbi:MULTISPECIES: DUF4113 domain-containing protein [Pseudomonas]|nr:DUF4113 domain-containing protein [Pseudomonas aeruginosa]